MCSRALKLFIFLILVLELILRELFIVVKFGKELFSKFIEPPNNPKFFPIFITLLKPMIEVKLLLWFKFKDSPISLNSENPSITFSILFTVILILPLISLSLLKPNIL